jgi:hypothetical protein
VILVEDFEKALLAQFPEDALTMVGKSRTRNLNVTDHVKAHLTRTGWLSYLEKDGKRYMLFVRAVGYIEGAGNLHEEDTLQAIIRSICKIGGIQ